MTQSSALPAAAPTPDTPLPWEALFLAAPMAASVSRFSDGCLLAVNDAWLRLTGMRREDALGCSTVDLGHWSSADQRRQYLDKLGDSSIELTFRLVNIGLRRVRVRGTVLNNGEEALLLTFLEDITDLHEAEQALQRANQELQRQVAMHAVMERLANVGYWISARSEDEVTWSPGLSRLTGRSPTAAKKKLHGRDLIHPDDIPEWLAAREARDESHNDFRWLHPDGGTRWFRASVGSLSVAGMPEADFGVMMDVTAEKAAAAEISNQLHFIRQIASRLPGLIYQARLRVDGRSEFSYVNDAAHDLLELDPEVLRQDARILFQRVDPRDRPSLEQALRVSARDLTPIRHAYRVHLPRAGMRWFNVEAVPEREPDGSVLWHGFTSDVTEMKHAQHAIDRQHRMLEAVSRALSLFIENEDKRKAFEGLLEALLSVTSSAYGLVGEVLHDGEGRPFLRAHAITDISWDDASRQRYRSQLDMGMEFRNLDTLFGHVLRTGETVIANDAPRDPRAGGIPPGHPPLDAFLGIPLSAGDRLVAMVGLANQPGGYSQADVDFLQPLLGAVRQMVLAWRAHGERQRARQQLQATGALLAEKSAALQLTFDSMAQGLIMVDGAMRIRFYNRRLLEMLELPEALMAGQPLYHDVVKFQAERGDFGEDYALVEAAARPFVGREPEALPPTRYLRRTPDGRVFEIETRYLDDGGMVRTYADVTSFIDVENALREERQRLQWVLEATRPGIWETNLVTREMTINDRWAEMLGYTVEELQPVARHTWWERVHPDDLARAQRALDRHVRDELPYYECDLRMRHKDGRWIWINDRGRVHRRDGQGQALFMSGTHIDIHDRVVAEEAVRALNATLERRVAERTADLERSMKDMEVISYSIAHDLRAPLRSVNGFATLILEEEGERLSPAVRGLFGRIRRSSRDMGAMISDMLELLRVVRVDLEMKPVDMGALACSVIDSLVSGDQKGRIVVQSLPGVMGDATLLRQVLVNLVDNALKYSQHHPAPAIEVGYDAGFGAFFVRDNGLGFDMARAQKLFGLFQRLHTGSDIPGTGVGLAIVARIIERHGGRIWAEAQPDEGATFWWTLPLA